MFDCDLNAKEFFGTENNNGPAATSVNDPQGDYAGKEMENATVGSLVGKNTNVVTSNEDFSNYPHHQQQQQQHTTNEDFSHFPQQQHEEEVYYEGVALQTALSAFGTVASAVGGGWPVMLLVPPMS